MEAGVEVTDSTDRSLVGFSSGSDVNPVSDELAAEVTPDASLVALAEGVPIASLDDAKDSDKVIVCQGTSLSVVLEGDSLVGSTVDASSVAGTAVEASSVAEVATDWIVDCSATEVFSIVLCTDVGWAYVGVGSIVASLEEASPEANT